MIGKIIQTMMMMTPVMMKIIQMRIIKNFFDFWGWYFVLLYKNKEKRESTLESFKRKWKNPCF